MRIVEWEDPLMSIRLRGGSGARRLVSFVAAIAVLFMLNAVTMDGGVPSWAVGWRLEWMAPGDLRFGIRDWPPPPHTPHGPGPERCGNAMFRRREICLGMVRAVYEGP